MIKKHAVSCTLILTFIVVSAIALYSISLGLERAWTDPVIKNIQIGSHPRGIAFDSDNGNLYVANEGSYTVSVIDGSTNTVIDTIPVGE